MTRLTCRQLFWPEWGMNSRIEVAGTDGTSRKHLITENLHWPWALTIDYPAKRLYWVDYKLGLVECADLNGTNRQLVYMFPAGELML